GAGPRGPGHKPVERVEQNSESDRLGRLIEITVTTLKRGEHRVESTQHVGHSEEPGQEVHPPAPPAVLGLQPGGDPVLVWLEPVHDQRARTLRPPATCWPGRTRTSAPARSQTSTPDPKRILPTRPPSATGSPSDFQNSTRRAIHPAIWRKRISPCAVERCTTFCSFSREARERIATWKCPGRYSIFEMRPANGARFTCTSQIARKMLI